MSSKTISILEAPNYQGNIQEAAGVLNRGGVVLLPTETVYGLFGLLNRQQAVSRLKGSRPDGDNRPLTVHLSRPEEARHFLGEVGELGQRMMRKLWPGPVGLTFDVSPARRAEAAAALGVEEESLYDADGRITLRCPGHSITRDVLENVSAPAVGIGAGREASEEADRADLAIDAGAARHGRPSTLIHVTGDGYRITRAGLMDERMVEKMLKTTILFVCSGNTCRSAMSEGLARHILAEKLGVPESEVGERGLTVMSAGSMATAGSKATAAGVTALAKMGIDLPRHRSRPLTVELINQADLIFPMGRSHRAAIMALVPSAAGKVVPLDPTGDIEDPFGSDEALYERLAGELKRLIEARLKERSLI